MTKTETPAETPVTPPVEDKPPASPADAAALQAQINELKEQVAEGQRTSEFWANKAREGKAPPAAAPAEEEDDVLEAITTRGAKGFDALASKRGFIRRDEVQALIDEKASTLSEEQLLIQDYPDLKKKDSDFFKATALEYGRLVKSNVPQAVAMGQAARATELAFLKSGKIKLPGSGPTPEEKEAARLARIAAQGGDRGRRGAAAEDDADETLTDAQKHMIAQMGITEEAYIKRAKAGVAMKGLG